MMIIHSFLKTLYYFSFKGYVVFSPPMIHKLFCRQNDASCLQKLSQNEAGMSVVYALYEQLYNKIYTFPQAVISFYYALCLFLETL